VRAVIDTGGGGEDLEPQQAEEPKKPKRLKFWPARQRDASVSAQ
jgi:hypothetical protein